MSSFRIQVYLECSPAIATRMMMWNAEDRQNVTQWNPNMERIEVC